MPSRRADIRREKVLLARLRRKKLQGEPMYSPAYWTGYEPDP